MEPVPFASYLASLSSWPREGDELSRLCTTVARAARASLAAFQRLGSEPPALAWGLGTQTSPAAAMMAGEFARRAAEAAERLPAPLGFELLATPEYPAELGISYLLMVPVRAPAIPAPGVRTKRARQDYGRILAGFASDPPERDVLACVCLAQKLAVLAQGAELAEEIQLRDQFLSIASHELKTPLTSIYGVLQLQERMLRKEGGSDRLQDRQASYLRMVIRQTQRLNELIDGLLDVSRIQNGRFLAEPADTDVAALLRETMSGRLAVIAQETGVRLNMDAPEALRAWVDPVRMEEVLTNLVMNAIRFSPEGGTVWVRLRSDGERLHLTVRDQGPSVLAEDRERIFRPFERVQRTARFGGLGLGLFISRQIAQLHGGDVFLAESLPGKGNVFEAVFPLQASQKSA